MAVYGGVRPSDVFDELANVESESFYGEDAHVTEVADYLNLAIESSYNQLFQTVALEELMTFEESASIVLYEEGKLESFKNKVINWFKSVWAKIKKAYDSFLDKIDKMSKKFKSKMIEVLGGKDNAKEALDKFDDGKVYHRDYEFKNMGDGGVYSGKKDLAARADKLIKVKDAYDADLKKDGEVTSTKYRTEMSNIYKTALSDLGGSYDSATSDIRKHVVDDMLGSGKNYGYKGSWIKSHYKEMVDYVCDYGAIKRAVKRSYNEDKKAINDMIAAVKKTKREEPTKIYTEYCRKFISLNNAVMGGNLQVLGMKFSCYRAMVMKVIGARVGKPKVAKESAASYTSQSELVSELFNW